ncbi:MAG TPA: hypothetical protein VH186_22980 [Chloroflexia bacterium]|nr:hypothetical protein [Chloroflexia bacterium]
MPESTTTSRKTVTHEEVRRACDAIRRQRYSPLGWIFPVVNQCASCTLVTGGRPDLMACSCPQVIAYLNRQMEKNPD